MRVHLAVEMGPEEIGGSAQIDEIAEVLLVGDELPEEAGGGGPDPLAVVRVLAIVVRPDEAAG
ncbi:MAG TPA: hypothetical protein VNM87_01970, partial [Candidatus Udaeobacter sp.]|nr:hypothetical protein [Candidatus Udaeobacter sp.]